MTQRDRRWPLIARAAVLATLAGPAWGAQTHPGDSLRERVESAWRAGDWSTAEQWLRQLHRRDPGNAEILRRWGLAAAYQGDYPPALQRLRRARALEPDNTDILLALARVHAWRGARAESERQVTAVLGRHPDLAAAHALRGQLAFYRGDLAAAAGHYRTALELAPGSASAQSGLERVRRARAAHTPWRLDLVHARSRVRIGDTRIQWQESHLAAARTFGGPGAKLPWTLTAHLQRAERGGNSARQIAVGGVLPLTPRLSLRGEVGGARGADFLPRSFGLVGGHWQVREGGTLLGPTALDATLSQRRYAAGETGLLAPALEQSFFPTGYGPRLRATLRLLEVRDSQGDWRSGYAVRLDSHVHRDWEVFGGYSVAYETDGELVGEPAAAVRTAFGGLAWQFAERYRASCSRTRQERDHVAGWRRHEWRCSLTLRH
jgi:tetratricopeptide (TPR) repeat protein